jgi:hypothetical protein
MADKKEKLVRCRILRDRWDEDGKRHPKGTEVDVPAEAAMDGMESGALERVKK